MAGSEAEERIRAKAEAAMRRRWPEARIVHELMLEQGGIRIDLAAIGEDFLGVCEVKSERDVLKRLPAQVARSLQVADETWIAIAAKHEAKIDEMRRDYTTPDRLRGGRVLIEESPASIGLTWHKWNALPRPHTPDPRARFDLLWADEMRSALGRHFGGATISSGKLTRPKMVELAVEHMTGRELRRAVCAQLRDRGFPRADPRASLIDPIKTGDLYRKPAAEDQAVDPAWSEEEPR